MECNTLLLIILARLLSVNILTYKEDVPARIVNMFNVSNIKKIGLLFVPNT